MEDTNKKNKPKSIKEKTVITSDGKTAPINRCRKINGIFYLIGNNKIKDSGEVFLIKTEDGTETYYRKTNASLIWDYTNEEYCLKTLRHIRGIVKIKNLKGNISYEEGFFIPNVLDNVTTASGIVFMNMNIIKEAGLDWNPIAMDVKIGKYEKTQMEISSALNESYKKYRYVRFPADVYSLSDINTEEFQETRNKWLEINGKKSIFDKFLFNYTIGVEIETSAGHIPENELFRYGLVPLRDGSIAGHEFTSTVIDRFPFFLLKNIFESTVKNCFSNSNCSLHFHLGNVPRTKEFIVAFWSLYYRLQDSLDGLMPPYKRELAFLANKRIGGGARGAKDHCKRIEPLYNTNIKKIDVEKTFNSIVNFFNDGKIAKPDSSSKSPLKFIHNKVGVNKWDYESRYYSINLLPYFFHKSGTIEFRLHSGTVNPQKAMAWLFICAALVKFAEQNMEIILEGEQKIRLYDILEVFNDETKESQFLIEWLKLYIYARQDNHNKLVFNHDMFGTEFLQDHFFCINAENGKNLLNYEQ